MNSSLQENTFNLKKTPSAVVLRRERPDIVGMLIMSKTTYKIEANAAKAGKHWEKISQYIYIGTHELPSGRFCFEFKHA